MERRTLLATVVWDGGPTGNGTDFLTPANWVGDVLPQAADTASIGATGTSPTITISGTPAVQTVSTSRNLQLTGGTVSGGAWTFSSGAGLLASTSGGTLNNVGLTGGDLLLNTTSASVLLTGTTSFTAARLSANNAILNMAPGYTLNSLVVSEGVAVGARNINLAVGGVGTVTFGPSAVVRLASGSGGGLNINNNSVATLVNNGLITAEASGQTLTIQPTSYSNAAGTMAASGGGTIQLGGTFNATAGAGTFNTAGGTVNIVGTITNTGNTITLNASTGNSWRLLGGTINGGSMVESGGANLVTTTSGGTLSSVAITGDLLVNTTSASVVLAGTTSFTAARLSANNATLNMVPGYTLNSLVVAEGVAVGARNINLAVGGVGTVTFGPSAVVRLASGSGGGLNINNSSAATLVNNGLITAEATGQTLTIQNSTLSNNGTLQVAAGTMSVSPTNWTNAGTVTGTGGSFNIGGTFNATGGIGTFTTSALTVNVTGTITNTANTITLNGTTGSWSLFGGTINNGSVTQSGGSTLVATSNGGTLSSVAITGDLLVNATSASVVLAGTTSFTAARLTANNAILNMAPGYTLNSLVVAEGATVGGRVINLAVGGAGTVTVGASGVIRLASGSGAGLSINNSSVATLVNNGLITAEASGQTLTIQNSTLTNNGTGILRVLNGSKLLAPNLTGNLNGASVDGLNSLMRLNGTYAINLDVPVTAWGTLNLMGNWTKSATIDSGGTIIFDYPTAGPSPFETIRTDIISGRNGGAWNGSGIRSSAAAALAGTAVGYAEASAVLGVNGGVFSGESVDGTAVLVRHTYAGDANLNRTVDISDLGILATNWQQSPRRWSQGDFNYDDLVDISDLGALATNWQLTLPLPSQPVKSAFRSPVAVRSPAPVASPQVTVNKTRSSLAEEVGLK